MPAVKQQLLHIPPCLNQTDPALCVKLPEPIGANEFNRVCYRHLLSGEAVLVTATGDIGRWNKPGEESEVVVDSRSFSAGEVQD